MEQRPGAFDANKHLIKLRTRNGTVDYLGVAARTAWFRHDHPDGEVEMEHIVLTEDRAVFRARVTWPGGGSAAGYGSETRDDFADFIEKASSKALGRALAALGYGTLQAGLELDDGERPADAPTERQQPARRTKGTPSAATEAGWTEVWSFARANGLRGKDDLIRMLGPIDGLPPADLLRMLKQTLDALPRVAE